MKLFIGTESERNVKSLYEIIKDNVEPGTLIWTNCWRNYLGIESRSSPLETIVRSTSQDETYQFVAETEISKHMARIDDIWWPIQHGFVLNEFHRDDE